MRAPKIGDDITVLVSGSGSVKTHKAKVTGLPNDQPVVDQLTGQDTWIIDAMLVIDEHDTTVTASSISLFENLDKANNFSTVLKALNQRYASDQYKPPGFFVVAFWPDEDGKQ